LRTTVPFGAARPRAAGAIVVRTDLDESQMALDGGRPVPPEAQPRTAYGVSPDYFAVMNIPLVGGGRAFTAADDESAPAVAIINEWAARRWWPNEPAIGKSFSVDTAPGLR